MSKNLAQLGRISEVQARALAAKLHERRARLTENASERGRTEAALSVAQRHEQALAASAVDRPRNRVGLLRCTGAPAWDVLNRAAIDVAQRHRLALSPIEMVASSDRAVPMEHHVEVMADGPAATRAMLLRLADGDHVLALAAPRLRASRAAMAGLLREVMARYRMLADGNAAPLPPAPPDAHHFASQRAWLCSDDAARQIEYWRNRLAGAEPLALPMDRPQPAIARWQRDAREFSVGAAQLAQLEAACSRRGVMLSDLLLAAYNVMLATHCCQTDIAVAMPVPGARRGDLPLVALCDDVVLLRTDLSGATRFSEALRRTAATVRASEAHRMAPFPCVIQAAFGDDSGLPWLRAGFALHDAEPAIVRCPGVVLAEMEGEPSLIDSALHLELRRGGDGLRGRIAFDCALFDAATIERFIGRYRDFLDSLDESLELPLGALPLLDAAEHRSLVATLNATAADYPQPLVHLRITQQSRAAPDRIAASCGAQNLSYAALNARAELLAGYIRRHEIGPEAVVAIHLRRSVDMVVAILSVLKAGAAYLPIDPSLPDMRVAFMLADAAAGMVLTDAALAERLAASVGRHIVCLDTEWERIAAGHGGRTDDVLPGNPAYVIYTSGSTGQPKPVVIPHAGLRNYLAWCEQAYPLAAGWGAPVQSPLGFDLTVTSLLGPLVAARRVNMLGDNEGGARVIQSLIEAPSGASLIKLTPSHLTAMRHAKPASAIARMARAFVIGGEALRRDHVAFLRQADPDVALINEYGPTETVVGCSVFSVPPSGEIPAEIPIGRPIGNAQLYVLDQWLRPLPAGVTGELHIGGAGLGRGYLHRGGATADAWRPSPFVAGERLYRTGDYARQAADGDVLFTGRRDQQVKLRGYRIELREIEVAVRRDDMVQDCLAAVWQDQAGEPHLVLYLVAPAAGPRELRRLVAALAERLPEYMVPRLIVPLPALPVTRNGKIDRAALPPPTGQHLMGPDDARVEPRTALERQLADIWAALLPVRQFGVNDSFMELGGESMTALQIIARIQEKLGVELPLSAIFEHATLARLARHVEGLARADRPAEPVVAGASSAANHALSAAQQVCWNQAIAEGPSGAHFINPAILEIDGRLDPALLERALNALADRHRVLRSCFVVEDGVPRQVYRDTLHLPITQMDLSDVAVEKQKDAVRQIARAELHRPFELGLGPLLRGILIRLGPMRHCLVITKHQIVADGWSMAIMLRELGLLYEAVAVGGPAPLPALLLEYADYVAWQQDWLKGAQPVDNLAYWRDRLAGAVVLEVPTDRPRSAISRFKGATRHFMIDPVTTKRLKEISRRHGATLFMTLLTGYKLALAAWAGQADISVGTLIANRTRREFEPLVGYFVNPLVLRTDLTAAGDFLAALRLVKQTCLDAYAHQDLPFGRVVAELLGATPRPSLMRAMFALQTIPMRGARLPGLTVTPLEVDCGTSEVDLYIFFKETSEGLRGWLEFDSDLFDIGSIAGFTDRLLALLASVPLRSDV